MNDATRQVFIHGDSEDILKKVPSNSIDCIVTDPPYGISFMLKNWDKALPSQKIWEECLRILKPGSFAFIMSSPKYDWKVRERLHKVGFNIEFTPIYWAYATGFPKAMNISKAIDRKLGAKRASIGKDKSFGRHDSGIYELNRQGLKPKNEWDVKPIPVTPKAIEMNGSYSGYQPKPAVEVIIVAMKQMTEKTYVQQAMKTGKGVTWLDNCRIPSNDKIVFDRKRAGSKGRHTYMMAVHGYDGSHVPYVQDKKGRFPANLLVSDNILDDGKISKSSPVGFKNIGWKHSGNKKDKRTELKYQKVFNDSGGFSRYFSLDTWWEKLPFLIVPKPHKKEKDRGLEHLSEDRETDGCIRSNPETARKYGANPAYKRNVHPTVKPVKLMAYLVMLGTREEDIVLDPYSGSGTTGIACKLLNRNFIGIEINKKYVDISEKRISAW